MTGWLAATVLAPVRLLADACVRQPLSVPVSANDAAFAAKKGILRLAARTARRGLLLQLSGQASLLRTRLAPADRRILWIHEGMPQIGDALMDLAPRSLLAESGYQVDLFAAPHIAGLFEGDAFFGRVVSEPLRIDPADYDVAIVLSHDRKALQVKRRWAPGLRWVSMQGFYGGPDFHRAHFATQRLADLLGTTLTSDAFARHSAQKLAVAHVPAPGADAVKGSVALALGGVWQERTYHRWAELVAVLRDRGLHRFTLIGADGARPIADELLALRRSGLEVHDFVGRTDLRAARSLLAESSVAVCADGGLMHLALTTRVPVVALFGSSIQPEWRLPMVLNGVGLRSACREVDGIPPQQVADAVCGVLC